MKKSLFILILVLMINSLLSQTVSKFPFLSTTTTGVEQFIKKYPQYDGRGALVVIVDSGVDMGVEGLLKTSEDKLKVIDVMDFTSQGDLYFSEISFDTTENNKTILSVNGYSIYGYDKLLVYPKDSVFYGGTIRESSQKGSYLNDLNEDGDNDDLFAFVVFKIVSDEKEEKEKVVAFIDLNGDHHIDDEKMLLDYAEKPEFFYFRNLDLKEKTSLSTFALKILWDEFKIVLHTDDNAHGTHVAGISTGYMINGQHGYNGIAPGAQVISCKIGDNRKSGGASPTGAMVKAFEYGIKKAKELNMPVVFNLSYGIGSEWEGHAEMESYLNNLFEQNRDVVVCTSAGNSGPGISSSGLPSSARGVIATGAVMTKENAESVYGAHIKEDKIFYFSARGATVMKPDVISPGAALSTVPKFSYDGNMWGTSQASPQTAGVVALLMSAIKQENLPLINSLIKRAVINSGKQMEGYKLVEQGGGIPQVEAAFNIYKKLIERKKKALPIDFIVTVDNPAERDGMAQAFLWRSGSEIEEDMQIINFNIEPIFEEYPDIRKKTSYEAYNIYSSEPWISPVKSQTYYKNFKSMNIPVKINNKYLKEEGLYSGKIYAIPKGKSNRKENIVFEGWITIVIPEKFSAKNDFHITRMEKNNKAGNLHRYYIQITSETEHLLLKLKSAGKYTYDRIYLYDPEGRKIYTSSTVNPDNKDISSSISKPDLINGVYEIVVYTMYSAKKNTSYELDIYGMPIGLASPNTSLNYTENNKPGGELKIVNNGDNLVEVDFSGKLYGIFKTKKLKVKSSDFSSYDLNIPDNINRISIKYTLPVEDYLKMTDVSIQVLNEVGDIILNSGLNYHSSTFTFTVKPGKTYYLETTAGFAKEEQVNSAWEYDLKLYYYYKKPIKISMQDKINWYSNITLVPFSERTLKFNLSEIPVILPQGFKYWGQIFYTVDRQEYIYRQNIFINPDN
ncbi:MAG: S8 family serine peptidase [Calditrichia bacterium]|nr:S8 family serine peptidase [Calditrichia bacterium]